MFEQRIDGIGGRFAQKKDGELLPRLAQGDALEYRCDGKHVGTCCMHDFCACSRSVSIGVRLDHAAEALTRSHKPLECSRIATQGAVLISDHAQRVGGSLNVCMTYSPNSIPASLSASLSTRCMASPNTSTRSVAMTLRSPMAAAAAYPVYECTATA